MQIGNKVAIVTGAGSPGCGRAIALHLSGRGASVVVSDVQQDGAAETLRRIKLSGGNATMFNADVRRETEVRVLVEHAERTYGGLDILVNNASAPYRPGEPLEGWRDTVETDLLGPMYATRFAIDAMQKRGGGVIVNMGSTSALAYGRTKPGGSPSYDAAKAGIIRLTTMLAPLWEQARIRVNCLVPDWVATEEVQAYVDSLTAEQREADGVPTKLTSLAEIGEAVERLVTDETLFGRVLVWWSGEEPRFIPWADPGYAALEG